MGSFHHTRYVDAPAERVFRAFTDPVLFTDWMDLSHVTQVSGRFGEPGSSFMMVVFGPHKFRSQVLASRPPSYHEWAGRGLWGASYHMTAALSEDGGRTRVDLQTDYTVPFGVLGRWIDRRWIDRPPRTTVNREFDRMVELVSAGARS
jgi:uncharacterized protein YndB with AHSA1/START domain